jgi:hypothetical protein
MRAIWFVVMVLVGDLAWGQEVDTRQGSRLFGDYVIQTRSALGDYACKKTVAVSSGANAPVLMAANATIILGMVGNDGWESIQAQHEVLDGEWKTRDGEINGQKVKLGTMAPPLTDITYSRFVTRGQVYTQHLQPCGEFLNSLGGTCRQPFTDWPLMEYTYLSSGKTFTNGTPSDLIKGWYCVSSELKGGKTIAVFSHIQNVKEPHIEAKVTFEDGLVVRCEWFVAGEGERRLLSDVATQWAKNLPEPLPKRVHAKMDSRSQAGIMDYVVDFEWFFEGSQEFTEVKGRIQGLRARLGPEREIAGAEDPKLAPKPTK